MILIDYLTVLLFFDPTFKDKKHIFGEKIKESKHSTALASWNCTDFYYFEERSQKFEPTHENVCEYYSGDKVKKKKKTCLFLPHSMKWASHCCRVSISICCEICSQCVSSWNAAPEQETLEGHEQKDTKRTNSSRNRGSGDETLSIRVQVVYKSHKSSQRFRRLDVKWGSRCVCSADAVRLHSGLQKDFSPPFIPIPYSWPSLYCFLWLASEWLLFVLSD